MSKKPPKPRITESQKAAQLLSAEGGTSEVAGLAARQRMRRLLQSRSILSGLGGRLGAGVGGLG